MITSKPVLYACNVSEDDIMSGNTNNEYVQKVKEYAEKLEENMNEIFYYEDSRQDNYYLTRKFKIKDKNIKRYNKHRLIDNKIYFKY